VAAKLGILKQGTLEENQQQRGRTWDEQQGYTWTDYKTNKQIEKELKITPICTGIQANLDKTCKQNAS
jgi:hypothetical protein